MKRAKLLPVLALVLILVAMLTLVACNEDGDYVVKFTGDGVEEFSVNVNGGQAVEKPEDPSREGYTFAGWYLDDAEYDFSAPVTGSLTLTAKWTGNVYHVTLYSGTGTTDQAAVDVTYGAIMNLGKATPQANSGQQFLGWFYQNERFSDEEGMMLAPYSVASDITVEAHYGYDRDNVEALRNAITKTADNYTARYYIDNLLEYEYDCAANGIIIDRTNATVESGIVGYWRYNDGKVYQINYTDKKPDSKGDSPLTDANGNEYTSEAFKKDYYPLDKINADYFYNLSGTKYKAKAEYAAIVAQTLFPESENVGDVQITLANGVVSAIYFASEYSEYDLNTQNSTYYIKLQSIRSTKVDFSAIRDQMPDILPPAVQPNFNTWLDEADVEWKSDDPLPIDSYTAQVDSSSENADLAAAINAGRTNITYHVDQHVYNDYSENEKSYLDTHSFYALEFRGNEAHFMQTDYTYGYLGSLRVNSYYLISGGKVYRASTSYSRVQYVESKDSDGATRTSLADLTLGGNPLARISASMFEKVGDSLTKYNVKADYLATVGAILLENYGLINAQSMQKHWDSYFTQPTPLPTVKYESVTLLLSGQKIISITAKRSFDYHSNSLPDYQEITYTFDYDSKLHAPYDYEAPSYTNEQAKLAEALAKAKEYSNYTLIYDDFVSTRLEDYYGDNAILHMLYYGNSTYGMTPNYGGSSGFVYINDYAYFFDWKNNSVVFDLDEPWTITAVSDEYCSRGYMNADYLPLTKIDPLDFVWDENVKGFKLAKNINYYSSQSIFGWYGESESNFVGFYIFLSDDGMIEQMIASSSSASVKDRDSIEIQYTIDVTDYDMTDPAPLIK